MVNNSISGTMSQFGVQLHRSSKTKGSGNGKRKIKFRDKRRREIGSYFSATKMHETDVLRDIRRRGGRHAKVLKSAGFANVLSKGAIKKVKIKGVLESRDNRNFARQNIITKGTVINTELGKAEVTNRPGRDGTVNARLMEAQ